MEHLTKQQIVLVTLLVSFVSSIATGIVIFSLSDQTPQPVTQTINRVIERTIEKAVPSTTGSTVTKETVVVSEDDAVVNAIEKASKSLVRINLVNPAGNTFLGLGVVVSSQGLVIARVSADQSYSYRGIFKGGNDLPLTLIGSDTDNGLAFFRTENGQGADARTFSASTLTDSSKMKLGQKVIALGGESNDAVAIGIISQTSGVLDSKIDSSTQKTNNRIRASINNQEFLINSVLVNLSGEVVGLKIGAEAIDGYIPSNTMKLLIPAPAAR